MGVLPDTQFGDVATIDTGGLKAQDLYVEARISSSSSSRIYLGDKISPSGTNFSVNPGTSAVKTNPLFVSMPSVAASFDVLTLRRGEALQRWKEISLNVPQNYRAQIKAHFGVDVGENMSGMSTFVGGDSSSLDISEVVNTALTTADTENPATIAGKGVGSSQGSEKFEARDWGVLSYRDWETDRKSTRLNSSHITRSRMPSSA